MNFIDMLSLFWEEIGGLRGFAKIAAFLALAYSTVLLWAIVG